MTSSPITSRLSPGTIFGGRAAPLAPRLVFLGRGEHPLEVALASAPRGRPKIDDVRRLWAERHANRPAPLLLVVAYPDGDEARVTLCGPVGDSPQSSPDWTGFRSNACAPPPCGNPAAAPRSGSGMLEGLRAELIPGLRNAGLLATQELKAGVPKRVDWRPATDRGKRMLALRGRPLLEALGFCVETLTTTTTVLTARGSRRAVALLLDEGEGFEEPGARFNRTSPLSQGLAEADRHALPWVSLTRSHQVRLYSARPDVGVGRKGRAETYVELNLALLPDDAADYLPLLLGADALVDGGTIEQILASSADFAADLGQRLRERLYDAVPGLATAIAEHARHGRQPTEHDLRAAYEQTLTVLFRLLFVAYAEDRDLLPCRNTRTTPSMRP